MKMDYQSCYRLAKTVLSFLLNSINTLYGSLKNRQIIRTMPNELFIQIFFRFLNMLQSLMIGLNPHDY